MAALTSDIHKKKAKSKTQESEKLYRIIPTKSVKGNTQREDNAVMVSSANSSHLTISSRSGERQPVIMHRGMWLV